MIFVITSRVAAMDLHFWRWPCKPSFDLSGSSSCVVLTFLSARCGNSDD